MSSIVTFSYVCIMYFDHIHSPLPSLFLLTPINLLVLPNQLIKTPSSLLRGYPRVEATVQALRFQMLQPSSALLDLWGWADHWHPLASASSSDDCGKKEAPPATGSVYKVLKMQAAASNPLLCNLLGGGRSFKPHCREAEAGVSIWVPNQQSPHRGISQKSINKSWAGNRVPW